MKNIVLVGMSGAGKSSIGLELSKELSWGFLDMDLYLENREKKSIDQIFAEQGEEYFRSLENRYLKKQLKKNNTIIATGGGIVRKGNIETLKELGKIVYLKASLETLYNHIIDDKINIRPLVKGDDMINKLDSMYKERYIGYEDIADHIINIDNKSIKNIVCDIIDAI